MENMKNQGKLIAKKNRNARMFTLDVNMHEVNSMLFTHGKRIGDIEIWHKEIDHVNLCRNSSLGFATKAKGLQGRGPRGKPGSVGECENEHSK